MRSGRRPEGLAEVANAGRDLLDDEAHLFMGREAVGDAQLLVNVA
jgi:hypothetical protein